MFQHNDKACNKHNKYNSLQLPIRYNLRFNLALFGRLKLLG